MNEQLSADLPKESESQRIGRMAEKCFGANIPNSWMQTELVKNDFGYDCQIQVLDNALAKEVFRVQLKGTETPTLNAAGDTYSVVINLATVNYFARATEPVLVVLCDLSVDPKVPKNCPLYFIWIHDELRRLRQAGTHDDQQSVTLHVPKSNKLDDQTDVVAEIRRYRALSRIGPDLDTTLESERPRLAPLERAEMATRIVKNLTRKSPSLVEALAEDEQSSWVEAPEGSLHWHLREAIGALRAGRGADCEQSLDQAAELLERAKPLERADYWNAVGRLRTFNLDDAGARDAFGTARSLAGDIERHLIPWAEAELRSHFSSGLGGDFSAVLARLNSSTPSVAGMRARLIAAEGRFDDAVAITESIDGIERHIARAIIFSMQARWDETLAECSAGLTNAPLRLATKLLLLILRARSRFSKAIGPVYFGDQEESYLPAPGPAGTDVSLLHMAWADIVEVVTALRASGWTSNVELVADMWGATATMLGFNEQALPLMTEAAKARPTLRTLQASLESMAAQAGEFETALEANLRQPESPRLLQQRITLFHATGNHQECVRLLDDRWDAVADNSVIFGFSLTQGIHSARKIIQPAIEKRWTRELESRSALAGQAALFRYFEVKLNKPLAKDDALKALIETYERLRRPTVIAKYLLQELDGTNVEQARQCVEVVEIVKTTSMLSLDDLTHYAQALSTLGEWDALLELSEQGLSQFEGNDRLRAIGAIALDKLGRTAEAHDLLKSIVEKPEADELALTIYIRIASRSGFSDQAIAAIERIYSSEKDRAKQLECLRHLFALLHQTDPTNGRLVAVAWKIGGLVNQEDEIQEGIFLTTMFAATLSASSYLDEERRDELNRRVAAFSARFPNSRILKHVSIPSDASGAELIQILEQVIGSNEQQRKNREKLQRELSHGVAPLPYAWRPRNVLDGISDLPMLWEISKVSSWGARHLHLTMATNDWKPTDLPAMRCRVPLLDLLSLMVISDLDLFRPLFGLFPKIAVGKATMTELQRLLTPLSGTLYRNKIAAIQVALKEHFSQIEQPEASQPSNDRFVSDQWDSLELIEIAKSGRYLVYSDDVLFRIYSQQPGICTLDLLCALDDTGEFSARDVAMKIATLCSWRVGLSITLRYQLAILPDALGGAKSIKEGINVLSADEHCNALFSAIWNIEKPFGDLQGHAGLILRKLADDKNNSIKSVAALAGFWLSKAKLHKQAPAPIDRMVALLIGQATFIEHPVTAEAAHRLWSVYTDLIEDIHGHHMDDEKLWQSIRILGEVAAESDRHHSHSGARSLGTRLASGLITGTSDYELFSKAYNSKLISLAAQDKRK